MTSETTSTLTRLTELLAAHGVYALTIIFIFYQQGRAARTLKTAPPDDHNLFKKIYTSAVIATYALVVISTGVWIYATFIYIPRICVRGAVIGLTDQVVSPQKEGDPPRISESIAPESFDVDLYQIKRNKDEASTEGTYDLGWVLMLRENVHTLVFRFQHRYQQFRSPSRLLGHLPGIGNIESKNIERRFTVDLSNINYSAGSLIELVYQPDPDDKIEKLGKIYLREHDSGNLTAIPWEEITPSRTAARESVGWLLRPSFVVYAASPENSPFKQNGEYDEQFGRVLRERLSDSDLRTQLAARKLLVDNGKRSFKFILDTLTSQPEIDESKGPLISSLASAVLDIESSGSQAPRDIHLNLAKAFAALGDNHSSAKFFDKAGEKPEDSPGIKFQRGVVYYLIDNYDATIRNLEGFLKVERRSDVQAFAHTILGNAYEKLSRSSEAIGHYKQAISLDPSLPLAYNGLAYQYAEQGENLQEALRLANRALALEKDPDEVANYKDTKGWILHKMGREAEALPLIKEAAARLPENADISEHLKAVQASLRGKQQ